MNKDDVKKLDEITAEEADAATQDAAEELNAEELENVNGGVNRRHSLWEDILG